MKVMSKENQEFTDYVSSLNDTEAIYDSDYDDSTFDQGPTASAAVCNLDGHGLNSCNLNECNLNSCDLDDGELTCGDDFADNGETIQGGPCQDLIEYFSDKPYLD